MCCVVSTCSWVNFLKLARQGKFTVPVKVHKPERQIPLTALFAQVSCLSHHYAFKECRNSKGTTTQGNALQVRLMDVDGSYL